MTLEEQFSNCHVGTVPMIQSEIKECVKIADNHAIGFSNWKAKHFLNKKTIEYCLTTTNEQLLEIYKKEQL